MQGIHSVHEYLEVERIFHDTLEKICFAIASLEDSKSPRCLHQTCAFEIIIVKVTIGLVQEKLAYFP